MYIQYIHFEPVAFTTKQIKVTNWHDFISLEDYKLHWTVETDGKAVQSGEMDFPTMTAPFFCLHHYPDELDS